MMKLDRAVNQPNREKLVRWVERERKGLLCDVQTWRRTRRQREVRVVRVAHARFDPELFRKFHMNSLIRS